MSRCIILAGGYATRLRPLTLTKPKPLLPILGKPLIEWIIDLLVSANIKEIVLSVRYLSNMFKEKYGNIDRGIEIKFVEETKPLGDAGPLRLIDEVIGLDSTFVVVYGDVFSDVDIAKVIEFHKKCGGIATLTLVSVEDPSRYGVAVLDDSQRIVRFVEKPRREEAPSNLANAGIYVFEPEVLKYIPSDRASKLAKDVIPKLIEHGDVYGYIHTGIWNDIGVPQDYMKANFDALRKFYPNGFIDPSASIDDSVEIVQPVYISKNVVIERDAKVGPYTVLGNNVVIRGGSRVCNSVVFDGTVIDCHSYIEGAIIGERNYIGRWVRIESGCVLGDQVAVSDEVYLAKGVVVLPFKEVEISVYESGKVIL